MSHAFHMLKYSHMKINVEAIIDSISIDYPQFKDLKISEVNPQGHDHISYRLGHIYVLRFPSSIEYAQQVIKEVEILPKINTKLSIEIPRPLLLFKPNDLFPYHFSIMKWVDGEVYSKDNIDSFDLVDQLSKVLVELRQCPSFEKWLCGPHNFYRGAHIAVYEDETRTALVNIENEVDRQLLENRINIAIKTEWKDKPVFIHGDISANNIIIENNKLVGLIDFGSCGIGDPACDYAIAWTNFNYNERKHFKNLINIDEDTWLRASVWALWKALIQINLPAFKEISEFTIQQILEDIKRSS